MRPLFTITTTSVSLTATIHPYLGCDSASRTVPVFNASPSSRGETSSPDSVPSRGLSRIIANTSGRAAASTR